MTRIAMIFGMALISLSTYAQHDHSTHQMHSDQDKSMAADFESDDMDKTYLSYIELKNALVSSDAATAEVKAAELAAALNKLENAGEAQASATLIAKAGSLEAQRKAFANLSNEMTVLVKSAELSKGSIYVDFCPMANGGDGATWLSNDKQVSNPYYGDKMLRCGKVKETIK